MNRNVLFASLLIGAGVFGSSAFAQANAGTDGAARAGSNAGSSSITPTHAPARKATKPAKASAASHRMSGNATGMGSQAANATGTAANSH